MASINQTKESQLLKMISIITLVVFSLLAFSTEACGLRLNNIAPVTFGGSTGIGYESFDTTLYPQSAPLTISNQRKNACNYFITFSEGSSGTYNRTLLNGANVLNYQLYDQASQANILKDLPAATASEVLSGNFTGRGAQQLSFFLVIPAEQVVRPGTYTDTITMTAYEGDPTSSIQHRTRTLTISATVLEQIDLSLVNPGGSFNPALTARLIDFGILQTGKFSDFDLRVRSNIGYSISLSSQNIGNMAHIDPTDSSLIPFSFTANSVNVDLSGPAATVINTPLPTSPLGTPYPMRVTVGTIGNASAGDYQDNITITIIAGP